MTKFIVKTLVLVLVFNPLLVGVAMAGSADEDVKDEQGNFGNFVSQFPETPTPTSPNTNQPTDGQQAAPQFSHLTKKQKSAKNDLYSTSFYNQASESDWVKAQVMKTLASLAQTLGSISSSVMSNLSGQNQQTATPEEVQAAVSQTDAIGSALSASNDPQFQQMGSYFTAESGQIANGNTSAAQTIAQSIAAVPVPAYSPSYVPTQGESTLAQGLVTGVEIAASIYFGPIGGAICAAVFGALGLSGFGTSGLVGASSSVSQAASGAVSGQSAGQILSSTGPGAVASTGLPGTSAAPSVSNYLNQAAPVVAPPKNAPFTQTGSAPSGN
jgi:hypothetical protein